MARLVARYSVCLALVILWFTGPSVLAQIAPKATPAKLAFSELPPAVEEDVIVSPLTPREPPPASKKKKTLGLKLAPNAAEIDESTRGDSGIRPASHTQSPTEVLHELLESPEECPNGKCSKSTCWWCDGCFCQRLCSGIYHGVCAPDPCYEPMWIPIADSAFFTTAVRPISQLRVRWNGGFNVIQPDRAEFFWPRADGVGQGPLPGPGTLAASRLRYQEARFYLETAIDSISIFVEAPYRSQDAVGADARSGFGDVAAGFKTLLYDVELLQIAGQLRVETPTGNGRKGLGVEHPSLEPSLLCGVRIAPQTYLQLQVSEWIPIDGDEVYAGAILHYHASLNHTLARVLPDMPLIGTAEFSGYTFQDGAYTDPVLGTVSANNTTFLYAGGGLRLFFSRAVDLGFAVRTSLTSEHLEGTLYRAEFRWRF